MAKCEILQTFKGSQDGRFTETFEAGTVADLSEYLMSCAPSGSFKRVMTVPENKATITSQSRGQHPPKPAPEPKK